MNINCHVDNTISEERVDIYVRQMTPELSKIIHYLGNSEPFLWLKHDQEVVPIRYDDIFVIETSGQLLDISTNNKHYKYRKPIYVLKAELNNDFIEASRSAIFNYKHLDHLELLGNGSIDAVMKNHYRIPISRRKVKNLKERLGL
ncbi:LytTR family DNA-binding domain-containing protein [Limosilactobacillus fermentum]|uniref:LytTR family transcriptional regulator n=1 Tax=Limosilactobacillus fermentum TaxID=1613 RepID=A0A843R2D6_LIMFE|nr:LytTR family DNA-binding domain-containing protein [Limosilactobacillus fermentum]MPQ35086.1 LytTR family transcriptional regulator [Limosilactobacillus fermentum]